jgi:hypothetical protein
VNTTSAADGDPALARSTTAQVSLDRYGFHAASF